MSGRLDTLPGMKRRQALIAIVLSTTVSLIAAELALRAFSPRRTYLALTDAYPAMFDASDTLPYRLRPNYSGRLASSEFDTGITINAQGYRGAAFTAQKGDARRLLVIGDSFTFGWGVNDDETYPAVVERLLLSGSPPRRVEVINAGFAACYSPDTYYLYLKNEGLALNPDAIVVGVFIGNDLDSENAFENEWLETDAGGLPVRIRNAHTQVLDHYWVPRRIPVRYRIPIASRSHVFQGMVDIWWELAPKIKAWLPGVATIVYASSQDAPEDRVPYNYRFRYAERTESVFARVKTLLRAMHRLASEKGIPIYFMVIPEQSQLAPHVYAGLPADVDKPQRELAAFFDAEGMNYLDLQPWLRERGSLRRLYIPGDGHFTVEGNRLAAERLTAYLQQEWLSHEFGGSRLRP